MIPVANYYYNELLALDELSGKFFLAVRVDYKMVTEGVSVQVPDEVVQAYIKLGREGLLPFASEVESDYRRYRFYNSEGNLTFPHSQTTREQDAQIYACFQKRLSLLEVEVIRLLYLLDRDSAKMHINYLYTQGYIVPLDVFCLGVSFFHNGPLTNIHEQVLRGNPHPTIVIKDLESNPLYGCPDAAHMLLGAVARLKNPAKEIRHLHCLNRIIEEPNCIGIKDRLQAHIERAKDFTYLTIFSEADEYAEVYKHFQQDFPIFFGFEINTLAEFPYWISTEQLIVWQYESITCLAKAFARHGQVLERSLVENMLSILRGMDARWQGYSANQALNHHGLDPRGYNENTVAKPEFPVKGYEAFIEGLWKNYLFYFAGITSVASIKAALEGFSNEWNGSTATSLG